VSAQVLKGSKREIAKSLERLPGEVRKAIVLIEEPSHVRVASPDEFFASMEQSATCAGGADCSREVLYSRTEGESCL
jgi:hypothetical protein